MCSVSTKYAEFKLPTSLKAQPRLQRQESYAADGIRGNERQVNTDAFEKMAFSIFMENNPLEEHHCHQSPSPETNHYTIIVHGFFESHVRIVFHDAASSKITSLAAIPERRSSPEKNTRTKNSVASQRSSLSTDQMKTSSHADQRLEDIINGGSAIAEDSDTDYVEESAIHDDDDSSDWEDSIEDSGKSSINDDTFRRIEPEDNLTSRRSLISLMIEKKDNSLDLSNLVSQSKSAVSGSYAGDDSDDTPLMMKHGHSVARPIPVITEPNVSKPITSPQTTRRNMLGTELTESLRRNLLWERQQKSCTANAVLKRRHTSHDVANLKNINKNEDPADTPQYSLDDYNSKGW